MNRKKKTLEGLVYKLSDQTVKNLFSFLVKQNFTQWDYFPKMASGHAKDQVYLSLSQQEFKKFGAHLTKIAEDYALYEAEMLVKEYV